MQLSQALPPALRNCRAVEVLERSLSQNRLGHAILLHGESPAFLSEIAHAIAATLLETDRQPEQHPDCFVLRPSGKARMIKIGSESERSGGEWPNNSMRRLVTDLQKSSNQGGRKVALIFEADRMNVQSANAFLKTLEEPPAGTTLFLLTSRPYELLDTIRSRCLNFRIPAGTTAIAHADWPAWTHSYRAWLGMLIQGPSKKSIPHIMFGSYGLNARFQAILAEMTSTAWKSQKETLPEHISEEEKSAMEAGMSRGYRKQLFGEIEKETVRYARDIEISNPGQLPVVALNRAIESLEKSAGLLEINFNQASALELFFLKSLRIWSLR